MNNIMGDRIRALRTEAGMTQTELGNVLGIQKAAIQKYESGTVRNIPQAKIALLAELFHVAPGYLMGYSDDPKTGEPVQRITSECPLLKDCTSVQGQSVIHNYLLLDEVDQARVAERINTLLETDKYRAKKKATF